MDNPRKTLGWGWFVLLLLFPLLVRAQDTTPPSVPTNLAITAETATTMRLSWSASTDNVGVLGYEVFANGVSKGTVSGTTMTVTGLAQTTVYSLTVRARDAASNWSAQSTARLGRTWTRFYTGSGTIYAESSYDEETETWSYWSTTYSHEFPYYGPGQVRVHTTGSTNTTGTLTSAVKYYYSYPYWYWQQTWLASSASGGEGGNFLITGTPTGSPEQYMLTVGGDNEYVSGSYQVYADFRAPNQGPAASFTTTPTVGRAPLVVNFNGSGSTDPDGAISNYAWDFDNNGTTDATGASATTSTTYANAGTTTLTITSKLTVTDLDGATATTTRSVTVYPASSYGITVQSGTASQPYQNSGSTVTLTAAAPPAGQSFLNWSLVSGSGTFTSSTSPTTTFTMGSADTVVTANYGADTTPPSVPTNLAITAETATSLRLSWNASTDNAAVTTYEVFANGVSKGTVSGTTMTVTGLAQTTVYSLTVRARDAANNWSAQSAARLGRTWTRFYTGSGTIYAESSYDEETETWTYWSTTYGHEFPYNGPGQVRVHTTGSTNTTGTLRSAVKYYYSYPYWYWQETWLASGASGGDGGNFLITGTPTGTPEKYFLTVGGDNEFVSGSYQVFADFKAPNQAPTASFTTTPAVGRAPLAVTFNGAASSDPDGAIGEYSWDFDYNGSTDATGPSATAGTTYANAGTSPLTITAKLTVTDLDSGTATTTRTVTVYPATSIGVTVQSGTASQPYQMSGGVITLTAAAPPAGQQFQNWTIVSGSGTFTNSSATTTTFTVGSVDTVVTANYVADVTAPTVPTNLAVTDVMADAVRLTWTPSTDNVGVTGYEIFANGVSKGTFAGPNSLVTGLSQLTSYTFTVRARDAAGNWSAQTSGVSATTWQRVYASSGTIYSEDNYDEEGNYVDTTGSSDWHGFSAQSYGYLRVYTRGTTDTYAEFSNVHILGGNAEFDGGGDGGNFSRVLRSASSNYLTVRGANEYVTGSYQVYADFLGADSIAPSKPTAIQSTNLTASSFTLLWTHSSDNTWVESYEVKRNGTSLGEGTNYRTISGLSPLTAYTMEVRAKDSAGNWSGWESAVITTLADTTAPSTPSGLYATNVTSNGLTLSWTASTDDIGVTAYDVHWNGTFAGSTTTTTFQVSGITQATANSFVVRARDAASNPSNWSTAFSGTIYSLTVQDTAPWAVYACEGTTLTIPSNAPGGKYFSSWAKLSGPGTITTSNRPKTGFTMGAGNAVIQPSYLNGYKLTIPDDCTASAYGGAAGTTITITAPTPVNGYKFNGWEPITGIAVVERPLDLSATISLLQSDVFMRPDYMWPTFPPIVVNPIWSQISPTYVYGHGISGQIGLNDSFYVTTIGLSFNGQILNQVVQFSTDMGATWQQTGLFSNGTWDGYSSNSINQPSRIVGSGGLGIYSPCTLLLRTRSTDFRTNSVWAYTAVQVVPGTTIDQPPVVTTHPQSQSTVVGANVTFTVAATDPEGQTLTYQWIKDSSYISGATGTTLTLTNVTTGSAGLYKAQIRDPIGNNMYSAAAQLTIVAPIPPTITTQPVSQTAGVGGTVSFTVAATGNPTPTYQWKKDNSTIGGATSATLTLSSLTAADAGTYTVVVTNSAGSVTSAQAVLTMATGAGVVPTFTTQPTLQAVPAGVNVSFSVAVTGTAPFTYQWRRNNTPISGATTATYTITNVQTTHEGFYDVVVSNIAGSATSDSATLVVLGAGINLRVHRPSAP